MPPSRRRPVPTTPSIRPRVAGLRKRPEQGAAPAPETAAPGSAAPLDDEGIDAEPSAGPAAAEPAEPAEDATRTPEVAGLIEPREHPEAEDETPAPRPRPTGRRKRTGEAVAPSVLDDTAREPRADASDQVARHTGGGASPGLVLPIALLVLAALLVGLGWWFQSRAGDIRYNQALVDSGGTTEVTGQTREAVEKAFSYNYADVSATEKAAGELLVGKAKCQYDAIFDPVRKLAPEQKLVVTVKAVSSGVTSLDGDRATVLLFVDQVVLRTTDNQTSGGKAMLRVGAQRVDGRWKVDNMEMFGATGDQAAETAKC